MHRMMVRDAFSAFDGIEIDTQGDAFFFVFPRARDAVAAAVEAQRVHAASRWPGGETVRVRMGLHTGEPAVHDEGYVGLDVVRAARICTEGKGGQILVSETTRSLVGSGLPEGVSVFPVGQRHLRGIDEPERVYEVAIDGLEVEGTRRGSAGAERAAGAAGPTGSGARRRTRGAPARHRAAVRRSRRAALGGDSGGRPAQAREEGRAGGGLEVERHPAEGDPSRAWTTSPTAWRRWATRSTRGSRPRSPRRVSRRTT